jgi:hypothetical protein
MKGIGWFNESYRHSLAARGIKTSYCANKRRLPVLTEGERKRFLKDVYSEEKKAREVLNEGQKKQVLPTPFEQWYDKRKNKRIVTEKGLISNKPLKSEDKESTIFDINRVALEKEEMNQKKRLREDIMKEYGDIESYELTKRAAALVRDEEAKERDAEETLYKERKAMMELEAEKEFIERERKRAEKKQYMKFMDRDVETQYEIDVKKEKKDLNDEDKRVIDSLKELEGKSLEFEEKKEGKSEDIIRSDRIRKEIAFNKSARKNVSKLGDDWILDELDRLEKKDAFKGDSEDVDKLKSLKYHIQKRNEKIRNDEVNVTRAEDRYVRDVFGKPSRARHAPRKVKYEGLSEGVIGLNAVEDLRLARRNERIIEKERNVKRKKNVFKEQKEKAKSQESYNEHVAELLRLGEKEAKRSIYHPKRLVKTIEGPKMLEVRHVEVEHVPEARLNKGKRVRK